MTPKAIREYGLLDDTKMKQQLFVVDTFLVMSLVFSAAVGAQSRRSRDTDSREKAAQIKFGDLGEVFIAKLAGRRDLSRYQQGGNYDFRTYVSGDKRGKNNKSELIDFILKNWTGRHLAYVRYTYNSPDASATYHMFVEPDKAGNWTVFCRLVRAHALPGGSGIENFPRAYTVSKRPLVLDKYVLEFKGKSGRLVSGLTIGEY